MLQQGKPVSLTRLHLSLRICSKKKDEREKRNIRPAAEYCRICFENVPSFIRNGQFTVKKTFKLYEKPEYTFSCVISLILSPFSDP